MIDIGAFIVKKNLLKSLLWDEINLSFKLLFLFIDLKERAWLSEGV